jgi:hypothetical protein
MHFEDVQQVEDMKLIIDWDLCQQMAFIFEVPTTEVERRLPEGSGLIPLEARPGAALMLLGYNHYNSGNWIADSGQPSFVEITRLFLVQPDLAINMPIPRFTFFVDRIGSNNRMFVDQEISMLHVPSYYSPSLEVDVDQVTLCARARDDQGMIQEYINTHPKPIYAPDSFFGQYYTVQDDRMYFGVWYWAGEICVHQSMGYAGGIFEHPFLNGINNSLRPDSVKRPYMQIITQYDAPLVQRFYQPRLVRKIRQ